jgi:hypothetical protein
MRPIAETAGIERKTVRRYVEAAQEAGLVRDGGEEQLTDELLGAVGETVRPKRPPGRGQSWACESERDRIAAWLEKDDLDLTKVHDLLERRGVVVPYRTLHRFAAEELGYRRRQPTARVADGEPGEELQVDFGRMGCSTTPRWAAGLRERGSGVLPLGRSGAGCRVRGLGRGLGAVTRPPRPARVRHVRRPGGPAAAPMGDRARVDPLRRRQRRATGDLAGRGARDDAAGPRPLARLRRSLPRGPRRGRRPGTRYLASPVEIHGS